MPYKIVQDGNQYCLEKETTGERVKGSCHVDKAETEKMMRAIMANENMTSYIVDNFVNTKPGEPYRLLPFGPLYKGGKKREITKELATTFRLPHFKPPIKLGSHDEVTPGGGTIVGLEVRDDGLYAIPELTEQGDAAFTRGDYRYHSPEVIWEDSGLENPTTGQILSGPLIVGDALLHTPHLGEAAALYTTWPQPYKESNMTDENISVPASLWDKFIAPLLQPKPEPQPAADPKPAGVDPDEFKAVASERDNYKTELENMKAEAAKREAHTKLVADLQVKDEKGKEVYGMMAVSLDKAEEAASMLGSMSPEQREWCMRNFRAYAAQIDLTAIKSEKGTEGAAVEDPGKALDAAVRAKMDAAKLDYASAFEAVRVENPELVAQYAAKGK